MTLTSANVRVAVTGAVYTGATSLAAPTDASTAPPASWTDLGYCSEDGVTETRDRTTEQLKAWQGAAVIRETVTESSMKYDLTLIETNTAVVEVFYGSSVTKTSTVGSVEVDPSETGGRRSFIIDVVDGSDLVRAYLPTAEITEVGEQVYANGEPIGYPITITAYPGTNGYTVKKFYSTLGETIVGDGASAWANTGDIITETGHGLTVGDFVRISVTSGATGASSGYYYVLSTPTADTFTVSPTLSGSIQEVTADGVVDVYKQNI